MVEQKRKWAKKLQIIGLKPWVAKKFTAEDVIKEFRKEELIV